jgi:hypothetical protein
MLSMARLTLALDFLALRSRSVPAKLAANMVADFHGCTETTVLCAYELYNLSAIDLEVL